MTTLLIKTFNSSRGQRFYHVDPDSLISSLRNEEGSDALFIYKGVQLCDTMTFKSYSMNDGDVICTIYPRFRNIIELDTYRVEKMRQLEVEKLRITDLGYNRIENCPDLYRKQAEFKLKCIENKTFEPKYRKPIPSFTPHIPSRPSSAPLPMLWTA